jgi:hypothetical protein
VLQGYANKSPLEALAELIWNGLDAEASEVIVEYDTQSIGGASHISAIRIKDNGLGITADRANTEFVCHGDSWKVGLNGKTETGKRVLHGRLGRGRFYAYTLGDSATWTTVYEDGDQQRHRLRIAGAASLIDEFDIGEPTPTEAPTGTLVEIRVPQGKPHASLLADDAHVKLAARFAPHLLANRDLRIQVDGKVLDPAPLINDEPPPIEIEGIAAEDLAGHPSPVLRVIEWKSDLPISPPVLTLCNEGGAALFELSDKESRVLRRPGIKASGYLQWSGFADATADLVTANMHHPKVMDAAQRAMSRFLDERLERARASIVEELRSEGAYPYVADSRSAIDEATRSIYDFVLVAAQPALMGNQKQRALSARLLRVALEERPERLDEILGQVLALSPDQQEDLALLLERSTLPSVIKAATEITRRLDLLTAMNQLLYDSDESRRMTEVTQLHPLVKDNEWLFGEEWVLTRSEASLTNVLRATVPTDTILEEDLLASGGVIQDDGRRGRVDLLLQRRQRVPGGYHNLVVELKRPSATLTEDHLSQVKRYARALTDSGATGSGRWEFWLVGSTVHPQLRSETRQRNRKPGHVVENDQYDIWVFEWGEVIEQALGRFEFFRTQLDYQVTQEDALSRVRNTYGDLVPSPSENAKSG